MTAGLSPVLALRIDLCDPLVDLCRRLRPHGIGDVGVDVQCSGRRHMAQHRGEGLHIHPAAQCHGCKGMSQIMEPNLLALGVFQDEV